MQYDIFSSEAADYINRLVIEHIDSRLLIFLSYNPGIMPYLSEDGKFYQVIDNLYKLTIDASICKSFIKIRHFNNTTYRNDVNKIYKVIKRSELLRTVKDHNISEELCQKDILEEFRRWVRDVIGRDTFFESEDDFRKCSIEIEALATSLFCSLKNIIMRVEELDAQVMNSVREEWIQCIIKKYTSPNFERVIQSIFKEKIYFAISDSETQVNVGIVFREMSEWIDRRIAEQEEGMTHISEVAKVDNKDAYDLLKKNLDELIEIRNKDTKSYYGYTNYMRNRFISENYSYFLDKTEGFIPADSLHPAEIILSMMYYHFGPGTDVGTMAFTIKRLRRYGKNTISRTKN